MFTRAPVGMGHQFDFDTRLHFRPVFLVQELGLEGFELALGRANQITGVPGAQKIQVLFADHAPVQDPDAFGLPVFLLHHLNHVLDSGHVGGVAGKHLVADGQSFGGDHQAEVDLFAVRPLVTRIATRGFGVAFGLTFKICAGHVVEQELELHAKPTLVTLVQMRAEFILVGVEHVQAAIKPRVVDLAKGHAQQILQRALPIPALRHFQFALLAAEPRQRQNAGRQFPRHLLPPTFHQFTQQRVQAQPPPQRKRQIHLAEVSHPFHPHTAQIDLRPLGWRRRRQRLAQLTLLGHGRAALQQITDCLPPVARAAFQARFLAQGGHDLLPRPLGCADGLDQRPILVTLARDKAAVAA